VQRIIEITPVVILTTSNTVDNVDESFGLGAMSYLVEPVNHKQFVESMRTLDVLNIQQITELKLSIFIRHRPCFFTPLNPKVSRGFFCLSFFAL